MKGQSTEEWMMKLSKTQRGFALITFTDSYGAECSLQKSSLATEDAVWFGVDGDVGERMHLTVEMVRALLPALTRFADTGDLPGDGA
jgi:hypothetical protein